MRKFVNKVRTEYKTGKPDVWSYIIAILALMGFVFFVWSNNNKEAHATISTFKPLPYEVVYIVEEPDVPIPPPIPQKKLDNHKKEFSFKTIASFVITDLEGDDKIAPEPGGGWARFGINSKSNPDVNVWKLTRAQAYQIAKHRYWNEAGVGQLPEHMRLVAFDTAFHLGPYKRTKVMIEKAGDSPEKLLQLRRNHYRFLIETNPSKYKKYKRGWENRVRKVEMKMGMI